MTRKDQPLRMQYQTFDAARENEATYLRLQARVQFQVVDVAVQLTCRFLLFPDMICISTAPMWRDHELDN